MIKWCFCGAKYIDLNTELSSICACTHSVVLQYCRRTEHKNSIAFGRSVHPGYDTKSHTGKMIKSKENEGNTKKTNEQLTRKNTNQVSEMSVIMRR